MRRPVVPQRLAGGPPGDGAISATRAIHAETAERRTRRSAVSATGADGGPSIKPAVTARGTATAWPAVAAAALRNSRRRNHEGASDGHHPRRRRPDQRSSRIEREADQNKSERALQARQSH